VSTGEPQDSVRRGVAGLELSAEQVQALEETVVANVAIQVARQLQTARQSSRRRVAGLELRAEQVQALEETVAANVAVHVYRQLQTARQDAEEISAGCKIIGNCSNGGGCNIIGNCSSCSELMEHVTQ
jgi:hypothetical protein